MFLESNKVKSTKDNQYGPGKSAHKGCAYKNYYKAENELNKFATVSKLSLGGTFASFDNFTSE